jgi:hypothetical protein
MCQAVLQDPAFLKFLLRIDQDQAATVRALGCSWCGAHSMWATSSASRGGC